MSDSDNPRPGSNSLLEQSSKIIAAYVGNNTIDFKAIPEIKSVESV